MVLLMSVKSRIKTKQHVCHTHAFLYTFLNISVLFFVRKVNGINDVGDIKNQNNTCVILTSFSIRSETFLYCSWSERLMVS